MALISGFDRTSEWHGHGWAAPLLVLTCLLALACQPSGTGETTEAGPDEVVVAWVDGESIGIEEVLAARLVDRAAGREGRVEAAVLTKVAVLEAKRRKFHEQPEIEKRLRRIRSDALQREQNILREALKQELMGEVEISEEELRLAYDEDTRSFRDEQLRLRSWSFESEDLAQAALDAGEAAGGLDPAAATELPPFSHRNPPTRFARVLGGLRHPGERMLIRGKEDWLVVELVERLSNTKVPLETVRGHLRRRLERQQAEKAFQEKLRELRGRADVRINEATLSDDELWRGLR